MAEFDEQVKLIAGLRAQCRQCDEALYRARLKAKRTNQQLLRADQKQTVVNTDRDRDVAAVRAQIERLNARLAALREESEQLAQWFNNLAEQRRLIDHLQQNLASVQRRIAELRQDLAELQQQDPARPETVDEIRATEAELSRLAKVEAGVTASIDKAN